MAMAVADTALFAPPRDRPLKPWQIVDSRYLVQDQWMRLRADTCELPVGKTIGPYYVMEERDWVHVVAVGETGDVLTVRQYRHAAGVFCTELPGGVVDEGEAPMAAAMRELKEETGYVAGSWEPLGSLFANPARQTNRVHLFLARDLSLAGTQSLDESEEIAFGFVSPSEIFRQIREGSFGQSLHVASFFIARERLAEQGR